jgi:predicted RNA binding protein YcfA (HicA-like mRNA interferase family)
MSRPPKIAEQLRPIIDAARRRGWTISVTNGGHLRLRHPNGATVFTASSPSDRRARTAVAADLRRAERS